MQGCLLHNSVCNAVGRDRPTTRCFRVIPPLSGLPDEQYFLGSTLQHWDHVGTVVDLRLVQGGVSSHYFSSTSTGQHLVQAAARAQHMPCPSDFFCQAGNHIMHPDAQVLLVPGGPTVRCIPRAGLQAVPASLQHAQASQAHQAIPLDPDSTPQSRTIAVVYTGGIYLHQTEARRLDDTGRGSTMQAIRDSLGLHDPVFLRPQTLLPSLPSTQMVALELEDVDRSALVDLRNIGGCISFADVLPGASAVTCLYEAVVPPRDWHLQQALPLLIRADALHIQDSADLAQHLPSRRGVRVVGVSWKSSVMTPRPPEITNADTPPLSPSSDVARRQSWLGLWPALACSGHKRLWIIILLTRSLWWAQATINQQDGSIDAMPEELPAAHGFRGSYELLPADVHRQYADLLRTQPADALPHSDAVLGPGKGRTPDLCASLVTWQCPSVYTPC